MYREKNSAVLISRRANRLFLLLSSRLMKIVLLSFVATFLFIASSYGFRKDDAAFSSTILRFLNFGLSKNASVATKEICQYVIQHRQSKMFTSFK
jgi:hypothetical protein